MGGHHALQVSPPRQARDGDDRQAGRAAGNEQAAGRETGGKQAAGRAADGAGGESNEQEDF